MIFWRKLERSGKLCSPSRPQANPVHLCPLPFLNCTFANKLPVTAFCKMWCYRWTRCLSWVLAVVTWHSWTGRGSHRNLKLISQKYRRFYCSWHLRGWGTLVEPSAHNLRRMYQSCSLVTLGVIIIGQPAGIRGWYCLLWWLPRDVAIPAVTCYRVKHLTGGTLQSSRKVAM